MASLFYPVENQRDIGMNDIRDFNYSMFQERMDHCFSEVYGSQILAASEYFLVTIVQNHNTSQGSKNKY